MKVALIFPPEYNTLWMPYSSLPTLTAFLEAAGVETWQFDWNMEIHSQLLNQKELTDLWKRTSWEGDSKAPYPGVPGRAEIAKRLSSRIGAIAEGIQDAVAIFRDPKRFYDLEQYFNASEILNDALLLLASASWNLESALHSPLETLSAALDPKVNIYLPYLEECVRKLMGKAPDLVGLSVTMPRQLAPSLAVAKLIKEARPQTHVTLGGAYLTMVAHAVENAPALFKHLDSVVISEGEVALLGLARAIESGGAIAEVPGILYGDKGEVRRSGLPVMVDADELPTPEFEGLPLEKYLSPEVILPAFSSRGCYWRRCSFCARPDRRGFSQRSPGQVIKDITACVKKHRARAFHFTDNAIRPRRMAAIADAIVESGMEILWTARTKFSPEITIEWCERVAAGGLVRIIFGLESASKRMLDLMQKGFRVEDVPKTLQCLSKAGVDSTLYLMVGFPTETREEAKKTLSFIENLSDSLTPYAQYYISPYGLAYSSAVHKEPDRFKVTKIPERLRDDLRNPYCFDFETSAGMSRSEATGAYIEFREKFAALSKPVAMPHDMLMRRQNNLEAPAAAKGKNVLKMTAIPRLADDLRADKGYLKKGAKKIRIDEHLGALIELLDSKKNVKQIMAELAKGKGMSMANAFIYVQQLYEEGVIAAEEGKRKE